jgi:phospholipase C
VTGFGQTTTRAAKRDGAVLIGRPLGRVRRGRKAIVALALMLVLAAIASLRVGSAGAAAPRIEHVVVILQENH